MIRHFGRILKTPDYRLLKKVYIWDKRLNESQKIFSWSSEVKTILYDNNLNYLFDNQLMFPVKIIVKQLEKLLYRAQLVSIETECRSKPKLRTFITFKDFENIPPHVYKSLSFLERTSTILEQELRRVVVTKNNIFKSIRYNIVQICKSTAL